MVPTDGEGKSEVLHSLSLDLVSTTAGAAYSLLPTSLRRSQVLRCPSARRRHHYNNTTTTQRAFHSLRVSQRNNSNAAQAILQQA